MAIPDYQTLMLPLLEIAAKGPTSVPAAEKEISRRFNLTSEEREEMLPSGKQRLIYNRMHWAKTYMSKAGLVESPKRGQFVITERGKDVLARKPGKIDNQLLATFPEFQSFQTTGQSRDSTSSQSVDVSESDSTPEEILEAAFRAYRP